jgi:hypothetical protein
MMDDAFILYQSEIDALLKKGYQDAIAWIKKATEEFPDASIEDLLKTANAIVAAATVFSEREESVEDEANDIAKAISETVKVEVVEKPVAVEIVEAGEPSQGSLDIIQVANNTEYTSKTAYAGAGIGFDVLEGKFDSEFVSDAIKTGEQVADNKEIEEKPEDYSRKDATGFKMGGDVNIALINKGYVPPQELIVDMSINAPNIAPVPNEVIDEGYGYETELSIAAKEYVPPQELIIDNSIKDGSISKVKIEEKKGFSLFKKRKVEETPIAYLPPKEMEELNREGRTAMELEEPLPYTSKNKIVNEASSMDRPNIDFVTPIESSDEYDNDEEELDAYGEVLPSRTNKEYSVDYAKLQAEITAEKLAREEAERLSRDYGTYEYSSDTVSPRERYIEEDELTDEQRLLALKFPERPNMNTRQIIKDIRSIDIID